MRDLISKFKDWAKVHIQNTEVPISPDDWLQIVEAAKCGWFSHAGFGLPEAGNIGADLAAAMLVLSAQEPNEKTPKTQ